MIVYFRLGLKSARRVRKLALQGLEIGEKLLWKYEETRNFGFYPWSGMINGVPTLFYVPQSIKFRLTPSVIEELLPVILFLFVLVAGGRGELFFFQSSLRKPPKPYSFKNNLWTSVLNCQPRMSLAESDETKIKSLITHKQI